jgi:hypothetical protein
MMRLIILVKKAEWQNMTVPKMFTETCKRLPNKVMFYFEDEQWTFLQVVLSTPIRPFFCA